MQTRPLTSRLIGVALLSTVAACGMEGGAAADAEFIAGSADGAGGAGGADGISSATGEADDLASVEQLKLVPVTSPLGCAGTGTTRTLNLATGGEAVVLYLHLNGNLMANATVCVLGNDLTTGTMKTLTVTGGAGVDTLIADLSGGPFLSGTGDGPGLIFNANAPATDAFRMRGQDSTTDNWRWGLDDDNYLRVHTESTGDFDYLVSGAESYAVALGAGDDVFSAAGVDGSTTAVLAPITINGGAGDDTLTGGDGADVLNDPLVSR